jgi:hypothetical protein
MIVLPSPLGRQAKGLRPCPSGTFENSQQHARVIYGWVYRPQQIQSPEGTAETLFHLAGPKAVSACWEFILSKSLCLYGKILFLSVFIRGSKKHDFAKRTQFSTEASINQLDMRKDHL